MLTADEIERRLPVWHALSDLFLDTELQPDDYARIAGSLRTSGFRRAELRSILEEEVAPAFAFNLRDVAGEWCSWTVEEVGAIMLQSLGKRRPALVRWLRRRIRSRYVEDAWAKLEPLVGAG